ncbi:T6SS effector BTH_I2691 family protein [Zymobacter sp. IVIA_12111.31 C1]|uniref:T6SS effector BTH_I2691 family protein n=1 Tax=Zymobacter sp. IVIA_12111.31 C1 TaxID=3394854 RepID=UPI0039C38F01
MTTTPDNTINLSRLCACSQNASHAHKPKNGCEFCQTRGLPILPVRYAVTATHESRLSKLSPPPALAATTFEQHHYTLRLMRTGYLYLYDEAHDRCAGWFITPDAKFFHYALSDTNENGLPCLVSNIRSDENKNTLLTCNDKSHHLLASMIRWPLKGCSRLWMMYSELPIPTKTLQSLVKQSAWRSANMQPIDAQAWSNGQFIQEGAFKVSQANQYLAEANTTQGTTYDCHPFQPDPLLGKGLELQQNITEFFTQYDQKNDQQGLVMALRDDIAIIETLNHDRHRPERILQSAIGNPDSELRPLNAKDYERRRQLQCYCLLNILNDNEVQKGQQEIDSYNERYKTPEGRHELAQPIVNAMALNGSVVINEGDYLLTPEENAAAVHRQVKKNQDALYKNIAEYVDIAAFQDFKNYYEKAVATRDNDLLANDKDYSLFATAALKKIMSAFSWLSDYPLLAASFMSILLRCIQGNVMTPASKELWEKQLLPADSVGIIVKTLGLQDDALAEKLIKKFTATENDFIDQLVKSKNIQKVLKEAKSFIDGLIKKLSKQASTALMQMGQRAFDASEQRPHAWRYASVRTANILRLASNEPLYVAVKVTMPRSEGINFLLALPDEVHANPEALSPQMKEVTVNQDNEGRITRISNKPCNHISAPPNEEKLTLTLLVTEQDKKEFSPSGTTYDAYQDPKTGVYSVNVEGTGEKTTINAARFARLKKGMVNVLRAESTYSAASASVGMLFAFYAFGEALIKQDKTAKDWVSLSSSFLGVIKSGATWRDVIANAIPEEERVGELILWSETAWLKSIGHGINIFGIIGALYDFDQAVQAQRNGESGRVVASAYASAGLTAIGIVFTYIPLPFGIGQIVGILLMLLGAFVAWWGAQTLTLEQRMWFHRSVFGLPGKYYNAEHFGGHPPSEHAPDSAQLSYHKNALNDEMLALSLLVQGIKLEIDYQGIFSGQNIKKAAINSLGVAGTVYNTLTDDHMTSVTIKTTIPIELDCIIQLTLTSDNIDSVGEINYDNKIRESYIKIGNSVKLHRAINNNISNEKTIKYKSTDNEVIIEKEQVVKLATLYPITLSIVDTKDVHHVIAKDTYVINTIR